MDRNLRNIEGLFKAALDENQEMPSSEVWDKIHNRLDRDHVVYIKRKYVAIKRIALIVLFLLASLSIFEIRTNHLSNYIAEKTAINDSAPSVANEETPSGVPEEKNGYTKNANNSALTLTKRHALNRYSIARTASKIWENSSSNNPAKQNKKIFTANKLVYLPGIQSPYIYDDNKNLVFLNEMKIPKAENIIINTANAINIISPLLNLSLSGYSLPIEKRNEIQNEKRKFAKQYRFTVTAFYSPERAFYHLKDDDDIIGNQQGYIIDEDDEHHKFSSSFGVLINYKIKKRWIFQSGFTFSNTNITLDPKLIYAQADNSRSMEVKYRLNISSGYAYVLPSFSRNPLPGDSLYISEAEHTLNYIGIPLLIKYFIPIGKFNIYTAAGIYGNILVTGKIETSVEYGTNTENESIHNLTGLKSAYFSGLASFGVDYNISNKWVLNLSPVFRFALNSINKNTPVKSFPKSFGLSLGITHGL